jgi:hypothetical protein
MPVSLRFRCQYCDEPPDPLTQLSLIAAYLREHYGAVGPQVWRRPPYPSSLAHSDMDNAWRAATTRRTGGP